MTTSRYWQYVRANFWLQKFTIISTEGIQLSFVNPPDFYLLTWGKIALPYTSLDVEQNLLSDWLWAPLFYIAGLIV
jgi:hypothetical protein